MKYSVIIQDLTADQARFLINEVDGGGFFTEAEKPKFVPASQAAPVAQPYVPALPLPNMQPASITSEVDAAGLSWDERIHASTKAVNKDGTWKSKRGVQPIIVEQVTAELKARGPAPQAAAPVPQFTPPQAPAPFTPPAPVAAPVPVVVARDFHGLMQQISKLFTTKQIPPEYPNSIVERVNAGFGSAIATLSDVAQNPAMVDYAWQCLDIDKKGA